MYSKFWICLNSKFKIFLLFFSFCCSLRYQHKFNRVSLVLNSRKGKNHFLGRAGFYNTANSRRFKTKYGKSAPSWALTRFLVEQYQLGGDRSHARSYSRPSIITKQKQAVGDLSINNPKVLLREAKKQTIVPKSTLHLNFGLYLGVLQYTLQIVTQLSSADKRVRVQYAQRRCFYWKEIQTLSKRLFTMLKAYLF